MTVSKGVSFVFALACAGVLVQAGTTGSSTVPTAKLRTITSRIDSKGAALVIDASEPLPYSMTRPDPLTVVLEFRNVDGQNVSKRVATGSKSPISEVTVENADSLGVPSARVRIALSEAVAHRVRSEKNQIIVEFEKRDGKSVPYVLPPASRAAADALQAAPGTATGAADPISALSLQTLAPAASAASTAAAASAAQAPAATPQAPAAAPAAQPPASDARKYTGTPISLSFDDADLKSVLNLFAEEEGLNLAIDPGVTGTVNVHFTAIPWEQALDQILRMNKLGSIIDGTIVRIAPISVLSNEAEDRRKLADAQANEGELRTLTQPLSYAKAEEMEPLLVKSGTISARGTVQIDRRTNTLIITDLDARLSAATDLIKMLDKAQPQVEIEARIVQVDKNHARALGVQWGFTGLVSPTLGNTTNLAFPNGGSIGGAVTNSTGAPVTAGGQQSIVSLPVSGASSAVGLALGSVNGAMNLDVQLSALENNGYAKLLSTPRVSTQNNIEAEITQGVRLPYQTTANNTVTTTFTNAALSLRVTPQITAAGTVIMKIVVDNGSVGASYAGVPSINTQGANTTVLVNDGDTTVIGGIYQSQQSSQDDHTPGLSRIPLFRWLFKRDSFNDSSSELLIFITPKIIKG